jgi:tetraacyldisaccharide 4'-kinase
MIKWIRRIFVFPLRILSRIWSFGYQLRRTMYHTGLIPSHRFSVPVISVGNLTFGGTGKTPFIIWLAELINDMGQSVAVLTRGYKGKLENDIGVIKGGSRFIKSSILFGDEPVLISKRIKKGAVVVGRKRAENFKKVFHEIEPDFVLLDDGYQHLQIQRHCNIALFDAGLPLSRYKTAPSGYLREGLSAINDADLVIITKADQVDALRVKQLIDMIDEHSRKELPKALLRYCFMGVYNSQGELAFQTDHLIDRKVIIISAIASPESFAFSIQECKAVIVGKYFFPDHYFFKKQDLEPIIEESEKKQAMIICSEKDMVKIKMTTQYEGIYYVPITVDFIEGRDEVLNILWKKAGIKV